MSEPKYKKIRNIEFFCDNIAAGAKHQFGKQKKCFNRNALKAYLRSL